MTVQTIDVSKASLDIKNLSPLVTKGHEVVLTETQSRFPAQLALDAGERAAALEHARQARQLVACDGPPDYTYKAAYEEAGALVERLEAGAGSGLSQRMKDSG